MSKSMHRGQSGTTGIVIPPPVAPPPDTPLTVARDNALFAWMQTIGTPNEEVAYVTYVTAREAAALGQADTPSPAPPPDVVALAAEMIVATHAARQADAIFTALDMDEAATPDMIYRACDVVTAADRAAHEACVAYRSAAHWQKVRPPR